MIITILASDIETAHYLYSNDCPINRALTRAGLKGYKDKGRFIEDEKGNLVITDQNEAYRNLRDKVIGMCVSAGKLQRTISAKGLPILPHSPNLPVEDFSIDLPI